MAASTRTILQQKYFKKQSSTKINFKIPSERKEHHFMSENMGQ